MTKLNLAGRNLLSFITFYLGWWACALGASKGYPWVGPALIPIWVGLHIYFSPTKLGEAIFIFATAALGWIVDSMLLNVQVLKLAHASSYAPLWLVTMWVHWALSFESMMVLRRSPPLLILLGAISGPVAYYACEALHILYFERPLWMTIALHSVLWGALLPSLFVLRDRCITLSLFLLGRGR